VHRGQQDIAVANRLAHQVLGQSLDEPLSDRATAILQSMDRGTTISVLSKYVRPLL
jgi:hypothetical protein